MAAGLVMRRLLQSPAKPLRRRQIASASRRAMLTLKLPSPMVEVLLNNSHTVPTFRDKVALAQRPVEIVTKVTTTMLSAATIDVIGSLGQAEVRPAEQSFRCLIVQQANREIHWP